MNLHYDFVCLIFRQHVKIWYQLLIHFEPIFKLELVTNQKSWSEILSIFFCLSRWSRLWFSSKNGLICYQIRSREISR